MVDPIVRTVPNLIKFRGGPVKMIISKPGEYNYETSSVEQQVKNYTIKAIAFDAKESLGNGSLVKVGDKQFFVQPETSIPAPQQVGTEFNLQGELWKVYLVKPMNPSGTNPIYYEVFARR